MRKVVLAILSLMLVLDILVWRIAYQAATAPPPEALQRAQASSARPKRPIQLKGDGFRQTLSLNGSWRYLQTGAELSEGYEKPEYSDADWHEMDLPNNWYLAGLNYHGVIWFRRRFTVPAEWEGRVVRLRFEGVDYYAQVWLNGEPLGRHEGYFQPFQFDVQDLLNYGGENVLAVRVDSPYEPYGTTWPHHKELIKGIFNHHDTRPGGGWSPAGQEYNTGGIWNDVLLVASDAITVDALRLTPGPAQGDTLIEGGDALLRADTRVYNHSAQPVSARIALRVSPYNFESAYASVTLTDEVTLQPGENEITMQDTIPSVRLWWPWDMGYPSLYRAELQILINGQIVATREETFGFRQIQVSDTWEWRLNGVRFFPRGTNYIASQWLSETLRPLEPPQALGPMPPPEVARYADSTPWFLRDLQMMKEANLNFVRVHAHVLPQEFYRAADALGLLVWQDFPLQWGYSDAPGFHDGALRQLQDMIELLYNHPSIVVWTMHDESPWDTPEMASRIPDYDPGQNRRLDQQLRDLARRLDPTRFVHINSGSGDAHVYPGWAYGRWQDFSQAPGAPMITEYGAQALPNLETMRMMFTEEELAYKSGEARQRWEFRDFQPRETFDIARIDPEEGIEAFVANSQAYQANLLKFATEAYRRLKYEKVQGIFQFMFTDGWPSITWAVVDYYRRPKLGYAYLQTAMQPVLPSIDAALPDRLKRTTWVYQDPSRFWFALWVVNDLHQAFPGATLRWDVYQGEQSVVSGEVRVDIPPDASQQVTAVTDLGLSPGEYTLRVRLLNARGELLGENLLAFELAEAEP
jgi:beta-mannosidase